VFDKDNCLTLPHRDQLVPQLDEAWKECREAFGEGNVLIVSNSAGTRLDPGEIQAESVTHHLSVPVLRHKVFKPSYSCLTSIRNYFTSLPKPVKDEELIVVGDRIFTDIVMANRMSRRRARPAPNQESKDGSPAGSSIQNDGQTRVGPLSVWTTGVWEKESMIMRHLEKAFMQSIQRYVASDNGLGHTDVTRFTKEPPSPPPTPKAQKKGIISRIWGLIPSPR